MSDDCHDARCSHCGGPDLALGVRIGQTAEVGHIGPSFKDGLLLIGTEPLAADLCTVFATKDTTFVWAEGSVLPVFPAGNRLLWVDDTLTICQPSVGQVVQIDSVSDHVRKLLAGG